MNPLIILAGPTATGKSETAVELAEELGTEIISADSMQVFQQFDIGTAKPSAELRARVPHHLIDCLPPQEAFTAFEFKQRADNIIRDLHAQGKVPIIVGGTGLYFTALTEGLAEIPPTPTSVRARGDAMSLPDLLADLDHATTSAIDVQNRARVQRAWEVQTTTGRSIRDWQDNTPPPLLPLAACTALALMPEVDWLNGRIEQRFDMMMKAGARAEAEAMAPIWDPAAPSSKAIGAAEMIAHLQGDISGDSLKSAIVIASRQYAKRQRTWLRSRMKGWQTIALPDVGDNTLST